MDSSAPLSFPSEPDDIGDLFSSYKYESPELNSVDDFEGFRESKDDVKEASSGMLLSNKFVENENVTNEDIGSSCLLSLCSEPPDIKNWFSSYVYESPALDSFIDFKASVYNDINSTEEKNVVNNTEESEHISDSVGAPRNELGITPSVLLGCIKSAKDDKSEGWLKCSHKFNGITDSISNSEKQKINRENISAKHFESRNETSDRNLEKRWSFDESRILSETNSDHGGSKSTKNFSLTENINAQCSPEDTNKVSSTRKLNSRNQMNNKHSVKVPNGDDGKENCEIEFAENGFVSTRKHKQNSSQRSLCPSSFSITSAADARSAKGDATGQRKVLSETTNIQGTTVLGTTGKWKCPQRSKPDLGPPLKQLRLEKWVRRP